MKIKKFFILSILTIMVAIFLAGCSHDITKEFKESQRVAEEFLTIENYEAPKGYKVRYVDESEEKLYVKKGKNEIFFDISDGKPEMLSIKISGILKNETIWGSYIKQIEEVANNFLNTDEYDFTQEYKIEYLKEEYRVKYLEKGKKLQVILEIEDYDKSYMKITAIFDITEEKTEIIDIKWSRNEIGYFVNQILTVVYIILIFCFVYVTLYGIITRIHPYDK